MGISNTFVLGTDLGTQALEAILAEVRHSARSRLDPKDDKRVLDTCSCRAVKCVSVLRSAVIA